MSQTRNLVLGGTAFIGRRLVQKLLSGGHDVSILNRGGSPAPDGVEQLVADRKEPGSMREVLAGHDWDVVYDVSASVQVASVESIAALLEILDGHCGIYEFESSIAAYRFGSGAFPWREDHPMSRSRPTSYGGHKAAVEKLLREQRAQTGLAYTIIRPAAVYGPHNNIPDGEMAMFLRLGQRRPALVPHDGLVCFPYGHVDDLVDAMFLAANSPAALGEAFNVTADTVTATHYIQTIGEIVGVEPEIITVPDDVLATIKTPLPFNHRFQKIMHSVLSINKARSVLGFNPKYNFEAGHRQTYEWFLEQGLDKLDVPMIDPTWNVSWDFGRESELIATLK
jgi:nucleoside-diphosphate-sugar epimerase